jgi:hypothetical protein
MSAIKEPCYFAEEFRYENLAEETRAAMCVEQKEVAEYLQGPMVRKRTTGFVIEWADYLRLFEGARGERAIGEASVCYLWSPTAPGNIAAKFPEARIIMMLRDPVQRAYSGYLHTVTRNLVGVTFHEYWNAAMRNTSRLIGAYHPYPEFGLYAGQVARYLKIFGTERVKICFYDDYRRDPMATLRGIYGFLNVDDSFQPDMRQEYVRPRVPRWMDAARVLKETGAWDSVKQAVPERMMSAVKRLAFKRRGAMKIDAEDRAEVLDYYREDIAKLSSLLNREFKSWLTTGGS